MDLTQTGLRANGLRRLLSAHLPGIKIQRLIIEQPEMEAGRGRVRGWRNLPGQGQGRITGSAAMAQSIAN